MRNQPYGRDLDPPLKSGGLLINMWNGVVLACKTSPALGEITAFKALSECSRPQSRGHLVQVCLQTRVVLIWDRVLTLVVPIAVLVRIICVLCLVVEWTRVVLCPLTVACLAVTALCLVCT